MKLRALTLLTVTLCLSARLAASTAHDKMYELRKFVAVVLNSEKEPVYSEALEDEMVRYFRSQSRFDYSDEGYVWFKERLKTAGPDPALPLSDQVLALKPQIVEMAPIGVDGILFAEVEPVGERYKIALAMVSTNSLEFTETIEVWVEDVYSLQSFIDAMMQGLQALVKSIPFDGTVLKRDGFRVIIDRGQPHVALDQELTAYTMETVDDKLVLQETGIVKITEVGETFSFAKILVENKPQEVETLNKILLAPRENVRTLASLTATVEPPRAQLGYIDLQANTNWVTVNNLGPAGGSSNSDVLFPGGALHGEVWMTNALALDFGIAFGMSTMAPNGGAQLNSVVSDIRGQLAYRFPFSQSHKGPYVSLKAGYLRHQFQIDGSTDLSTAAYSGLLMGGGAGFAVSPSFGVEFEINSLVAGGLEESPFTSGIAQNISGWDFSLRSRWHVSEAIDFLARLQFQSYGAEFTGVGTRPTPITSSSQSSKGVSLGFSYYF